MSDVTSRDAKILRAVARGLDGVPAIAEAERADELRREFAKGWRAAVEALRQSADRIEREEASR